MEKIDVKFPQIGPSVSPPFVQFAFSMSPPIASFARRYMVDLSDIQQMEGVLSTVSSAAKTLEKGFSSLAKTSKKIATGAQRLRVLINKALKAPPISGIGYLKDAERAIKQLDHLKSVLQEDFGHLRADWEKHEKALSAIKAP